MSQLFIIGQVHTDPVLKWSEKSKRHYVYFTIAERLGYGEKQRFQYVQAWAWGSDATRLVEKEVSKHSRVWATGSVELVDYVRTDGAKTKGLKLYLTSWGFVSDSMPKGIEEVAETPIGQPALEKAGHHETAPVHVIRGDKDTLPE